ncbi:MAG: TonB-dependent receptor, partial [Bacteroidetes bacterium]|nr:TonB-dependent receptor [Bacteroidota bacterium]
SNQDFGNIIKDLNPDDFESITVLKGSAASALYGSKGLNGVLLITTKKGRAKKGVGVSVTHTESMDKAYSMLNLQNEFGGGLSPTFAKDGQGNDVVDISAGPYTNPNGGYSYGPKLDGHMVKDLDGRMVPWVANNPLKDFFQTGRYANTNVAAEGATENGSFRISYTNLYNTSVVPTNSFNKNVFTLRATHKITEATSLDASVTYSNVKTINPINQGGNNNPLFAFTYLAPRSAPLAYYKTHYIDPVNGGALRVTPSTDPYYMANGIFYGLYENNLSRQEYNLLANIDFHARITPWLNFLLRANINSYNDITENKQNGTGAGFTGGYYELDQSTVKSTRLQGLLTANKELGNDFSVNATLGAETNSGLGGPISVSHTNGGLSTPSLYFIGNSVSTAYTNVTLNPKSRLDAAYLYGDLTWRKMLTLNFTLRNDWSSALTYADGHGPWSYPYPTVGLSWIFTELPSFKNSNSIISFGKLRANLGYTGYSADPYVTNSTGLYGQVGSFNGPGNSTQTIYSFNGNTLGNQNLKNELGRELEFGAEMRFLNDRLGFDLAYYKKNSFNQILSLPSDQESGVGSRNINAGNIQNAGVELLITATPVKSKDFTWNATFNFAKNKNKVISLYPGVTSYQLELGFGADVAAYAYAGKDYGTLTTGYGFAKYQAKDANGAPVSNANNGLRVIGAAPYGTTGNYYTFLRSQDYDGSTKNLGTIMPSFLAGTVQEFSYKAFMLSFQIDAKVGGLMGSATDQYGMETGNGKNTLYGRNTALGGITFTDNNGVTRNDGIIPDGVLAPGTTGTTTAGAGVDVGGMKYADAVKAGLVTPIPAYAYYENLTQWSSGIREVSIFDNSWVALRQVSVGYNMPASIYRKAHLNGLRISLVGRNIVYLYKSAKDGVNPEGLYSNRAAAFMEYGGLPLIRSLGATINASF